MDAAQAGIILIMWAAGYLLWILIFCIVGYINSVYQVKKINYYATHGEFIGAGGVMCGLGWPLFLAIGVIAVFLSPLYFAGKSFDRRFRAHVSMKKISPIEDLELEIIELDKELESLRG